MRISPRLHTHAIGAVRRDLSDGRAPPEWMRSREGPVKFASRPSEGKTLSTGAVAIFVALRLCDRLSLYGFGTRREWDVARKRRRCPPEPNASWPQHPYHGCAKYYGHMCISLRNYLEKDTRFHDLEAEHQWIDFLSRSGRLTEYC